MIRRNAERLGATVEILGQSALALPRSAPFDLMLADPPYSIGSGSAVVHSVLKYGWLASCGWISVETSKDDAVDPRGLSVEATRDVGRAKVTLLRRP